MRTSVFASARPPAIADIGDAGGWRFETKALAPDFARFEVRSGASDTPTISIFDQIGSDGGKGGVTPSRIAAALRSIGERPLTVEINSPGGDYFDGVAIFNLLQRHPKAITVQVLGYAASAASVIAMAGDQIEIARNAQIMIHQSRGMFFGRANEIEAAANILTQCDQAMSSLYSARTGLSAGRIDAMMDAETWLPAKEAVKLGFADSIMDRAAQPIAYADKAKPADMQSLDRLLAQQGMTRTDRRELYRAIKTEPAAQSEPAIITKSKFDRAALLRALSQ